MRTHIKNFQYGVVNKIEPESIPVGSLASSKGFITKGDRMELARGTKIIGDEVVGGKVTGLIVVKRTDGTEIIFRKRGRKLEYSVGSTFGETGTDMFPAVAEDDEATFVPHLGLAGDAMFVSTPNSSIYKIMIANPQSYTDLLSTDYKGRIFGSQNRLFLGRRRGSDNSKDETGLYLSYIDEANYTTVSSENVGTGDGSSVTFTDTLAFKAGGSKRTCFAITVTDGVETFRDNIDGTLVGSLGGTGTINYTTGAISVTFNTAPANAQAVTCDYQWEDSSNGGLTDFTFTTPNRLAGEGDVFRQDTGGGAIQAVDSYANVEYCFHEFKTWALELTADDTNAVNDEYRKKVGIPNWQSRVATGDGIYFIDVVTERDPSIRVLTYNENGDRVIPLNLSEKVDLSEYKFEKSWMEEWGDYIVIGCRTKDSIENDTVILYNKVWKSFDFIKAYTAFGQVFDSGLIVGDSLSGTVYELFSGWDVFDQPVDAEVEISRWDLDIDRLKKVKTLILEGDIQTAQKIGVYANPDETGYQLLGYITGDGLYVDKTEGITIGSKMIGGQNIGGGTEEVAYHYIRELKMTSLGKFNQVDIKLKRETIDGQAGFGYFDVSRITFDDIRQKQQKEARRFRRERV